jgi:hypothetical protein
LNVTRKVFSPAAGGFARYLEIITNPSRNTVTATIEVQTDSGSSNSTSRVVVSPADTSNRYAVTDDTSSTTRPVLAHVFGGANAAVSVNATDFRTGEDDMFMRWRVTVPAGATMILMHFAAQRAPGNTTGAQTQAESLVNLTDPAALQGMSTAERAQVVNFRIP